MNNILSKVSTAKKIAIAGHVRPDGDCIGSCMAMCNYLMKKYPDKQVDVYLESIPDCFRFIPNVSLVKENYQDMVRYDVFVSLDCGDVERLGKAGQYFSSAKHSINIDHHISNTLFADVNYVLPDASSTCETLYGLLEETMIDLDIATCLYTGIVHDTGVFKHSNTSEHTMVVAGKLIRKGVPFSKIIDESFYQKTYLQNRILGQCLIDSKLYLEQQCIVSVLRKETMDSYHVTKQDLEGIIVQLRITEGVEVAIFLHEMDVDEYKVSMRAKTCVDVSQIAVSFGGGGHVRASGCTMRGQADEIVQKLVDCVGQQLQEQA